MHCDLRARVISDPEAAAAAINQRSTQGGGAGPAGGNHHRQHQAGAGGAGRAGAAAARQEPVVIVLDDSSDDEPLVRRAAKLEAAGAQPVVKQEVVGTPNRQAVAAAVAMGSVQRPGSARRHQQGMAGNANVQAEDNLELMIGFNLLEPDAEQFLMALEIGG